MPAAYLHGPLGHDDVITHGEPGGELLHLVRQRLGSLQCRQPPRAPKPTPFAGIKQEDCQPATESGLRRLHTCTAHWGTMTSSRTGNQEGNSCTLSASSLCQSASWPSGRGSSSKAWFMSCMHPPSQQGPYPQRAGGGTRGHFDITPGKGSSTGALVTALVFSPCGAAASIAVPGLHQVLLGSAAGCFCPAQHALSKLPGLHSLPAGTSGPDQQARSQLPGLYAGRQGSAC